MKRVVPGLALALLLAACAGKTEEAIGLAWKVKKCADFEFARHDVLMSGNRLPDNDIDEALRINRLATSICANSLDDLTAQMKGLAP